MSSRSTMIRFPGALGANLAARLDLPANTPRAYALFAHCFTCSKDTLAAVRISHALTELGIAVLRFDFTGLGGSEGEFGNTNFSSNVADLIAAAEWLRHEHSAPKLLVGHSLGGAAMLAAAHAIPGASAVATIGAPADPEHVRHLLGSSITEIERAGEARVTLAQRTFTIKKQFLDDLRAQRMNARIAELGKALLVLHSPRDTTVDVANAAHIFTAAKHPKSFVSLDTADHLLTNKDDAVYVANVLAAWSSRYMDASASEPVVAQSDGTVLVSEAHAGKFTQRIIAGRHSLIADEPVSYGGSDSGPTPYDLLTAALGACTSMTIRLYAESKKLELEHVAVRLKHSKVHAEDCIACDAKETRMDRIEREIELTGRLDDAQRKRLLEIADRCPVHRTLETGVAISTQLKT